MSEQQKDFPTIDLKPIVSYPREAQAGQTYLMTIDVQMTSAEASWPYPDEEYPISFVLDTYPYFSHELLDGRQPSVVLHRFGGTYGPARYLLTATKQIVEPGHIYVTLINGGGLPIAHMALECEVKQTVRTGDGRKVKTLRKEKEVIPQATTATVGSKEPLSLIHTHAVIGCAISADGRWVVSASADGVLRMWDAHNGAEQRTFTDPHSLLTGCAISADGRWVVSASADGVLRIWDAHNGAEQRTFTEQHSSVTRCAISADGCWVVSWYLNGILKVWDVHSGEENVTFKGHISKVHSCAISGDGNWMVSAAQTLKVWDMHNGKEKVTLKGHTNEARSCAINGDGRWVVSTAYDNTLRVWDVRNEREQATLIGHTDWVNECAVSGNGHLVVSASRDKTLKVWNAYRGVEQATLIGHTDEVNGCAVSGNGHLVVSASRDKTLKVWDISESFAAIESDYIYSTLIEEQLLQAGWIIQDGAAIILDVAQSIAIREASLNTNYFLAVGGSIVGAIRAREADTITEGVYPRPVQPMLTIPFILSRSPLPFSYEVVGQEIQFTNELEPDARTRRVSHFHRPETLARWLSQAPVRTPNDLNDLLRSRLRRMSPADVTRLYDQDVSQAIAALEKSLQANRPRAFVQMPDGGGKTPALAYMAYRLLYFARAQRVLCLVNSEEYAYSVYAFLEDIEIPGSEISFTELFHVQVLQNATLDTNAHLYISTIEQLYLAFTQTDMLILNEAHFSAQGFSEKHFTLSDLPYNPSLPIEFFDVILMNNLAPEVYRDWRPLLEYFDAFMLGAINRADKVIAGFFGQNLVYDYADANSLNSFVQHLWKYYDELREYGFSREDYLEQLTYLLFLKAESERTHTQFQSSQGNNFNWATLLLDDPDYSIASYYRQALSLRDDQSVWIGEIFKGAHDRFRDPYKLRELIQVIEREYPTGANNAFLGELYEKLLIQHAQSTKTSIGQYVTPGVLVQTVVDVMQPEAMMQMCDPACGVGEFLVAAYEHVIHESKYEPGSDVQRQFQKFFLSGMEKNEGITRLCAMNLFAHNIAINVEARPIRVGDSLSGTHISEKFDMVLSNLPFGKINDYRIMARTEFRWGIPTKDADLAYVQLVYSLLKPGGRAALVTSNVVLARGGRAGEDIRRTLLDTCDFHTLLLLPENTFYHTAASGAVLFFDKLTRNDRPGTRELWVYDLRTNMHVTQRKNPLIGKHFEDFIRCYNPGNRHGRQETQRFRRFSYDELIQSEGCNFNITWMNDNNENAVIDPLYKRFFDWLTTRQQTRMQPFTDEQVLWLERIRDRIVSDGREFTEQDFERSPFTFDGGLTAARFLFGKDLPALLQELNLLLSSTYDDA